MLWRGEKCGCGCSVGLSTTGWIIGDMVCFVIEEVSGGSYQGEWILHAGSQCGV